ncbi:7649_t:CDS:2, partial [Racocetra fulgida]
MNNLNKIEDNSEYYYKIIEDDSKYYYNNDFIIETAKNSVVPSEISCSLETATSSIQPMPLFTLSLKDKEKLSFTYEYFETTVNQKGDEVRVCKVINEDGKKCGPEYKNVESSTGNLIMHFRDTHEIVSQNDRENIKK